MMKSILNQEFDVIVFCHLRWEFVYQRPQHIISRLAKLYKVLYVEEPVNYSAEEENTAHFIQVNEHLVVMQPRVANIHNIKNLFDTITPAKIGWFYSPAFLPLLSSFSFEKVVYDCMDELSLFKGADPMLMAQEKDLMTRAKIVFTGGKRLYENKKENHSNVHCFPSSVDIKHFKKALNGIDIPTDMPMNGRPIIGYYGVIDERIDMELIAEAAKELPQYAFVMIGPLAKISEHDLAKADNIHYLGMKSYEQLPAYLKGFDIAMMPFAMNESTKYISPTKTLEYMAAYKPIISTPVYDVVRDYSHCVHIVQNASDFKCAVEEIQREGRWSIIPDFDEILERTSWDKTVDDMVGLIQ